MATARCYTKSGSVEKYEPNFFSGTTDYHPVPFTTIMTEPDSNGNYSITYDGYHEGNSNHYDCYCKTLYGHFRNGNSISKTFYFIRDEPSYPTITFKLSSISTSGYIQINCSQSGPLEVDIECKIERILGNGIKRSYLLLYEKSNRMCGYQQFYVTEKPSLNDAYSITSVYPTRSENIKYKGYYLGITVH